MKSNLHAFFTLASIVFSAFPLSAQNADNLVFTVGNSYQVDDAQFDFFLWQPGNIERTLGKTFGVYAKSGNPDSAQPYQLISTQKLQTGPSAILPLLKMAAKFDHDAAELPERVTALEAEIVGRPIEGAIPTEANLAVASSLAAVIASAKEDPANLQSLLSLGRTHPGVMMSMGHAFACQVPPASTHTYEVRELDQAGQDLRVLGRVTIAGNSAFSPQAPGPPIAVSHTNEETILNPERLNTLQLAASGKDHLNARFRWGLSPSFRENLPKTYGFNLYRVPNVNGLDPNAITSAELALNTHNGVKVNNLPVAADPILSPAQAENLSFQPSDFFTADDKNPPNDPFEDGEEFYYYVAARDIAGHPGPLSEPTFVTICDRLPPAQASIQSVENVFDFESADFETGTGTQHLRIKIRQTPEEPVEDRAKRYYVYRWYAANDWMRHGGDPAFNLIGEVEHLPGETFVTFDDNNLSDVDTDGDGPITQAAVATSSTDSLMGKTVWYTVRSVDEASCVPPNMAGHSGAVYGVLRDRVGPGHSSGFITSCYCTPTVLQAVVGYGKLSDSRDPNVIENVENGGGFFQFLRTRSVDGAALPAPKVKGFQFRIGNREDQKQERLEHYNRYFEFESDEQSKSVFVPGLLGLYNSFHYEVRCFLTTGAVSAWRRLDPLQGSEIDPQDYFAQGIAILSYDEIKLTSPDLDGPLPQDVTGLDGVSRPPVFGSVSSPPDGRELRIYRRAGLGQPLQLIDKIVGDPLPNPYEFSDALLPIAHATEVCYYAMTLDEHGNASPLDALGCVEMLADKLPVPQVAEPASVSTTSLKDTMTLSWTCDTVGVDHFEVWAATETGDTNLLESAELDFFPDVDPALSLPGGDGQILNFARFDTPSIGGGFGSDGTFSIEFQKPKDLPISLYVRAVGIPIEQAANSYAIPTGEVSNLVVAVYREEPSGPTNVIPWPARNMPPVSQIQKEVRQYAIGAGPFYAHPIDRNQMQSIQASSAILVGSLRGGVTAAEGNELLEAVYSFGNEPFTQHLFDLPESNLADGEEGSLPSFPFALYRHQVPSGRFPDAQPNLLQCTPLIDRIAVLRLNDDTIQGLVDPFLFGVSENSYSRTGLAVPDNGVFGRDPASFNLITPTGPATTPPYLNHPVLADPKNTTVPISLWLRDPQPVTKGARYQYILAHFDERGEIRRLTPTNIVQH